jgi:hypothetical protein
MSDAATHRSDVGHEIGVEQQPAYRRMTIPQAIQIAALESTQRLDAKPGLFAMPLS